MEADFVQTCIAYTTNTNAIYFFLSKGGLPQEPKFPAGMPVVTQSLSVLGLSKKGSEKAPRVWNLIFLKTRSNVLESQSEGVPRMA